MKSDKLYITVEFVNNKPESTDFWQKLLNKFKLNTSASTSDAEAIVVVDIIVSRNQTIEECFNDVSIFKIKSNQNSSNNKFELIKPFMTEPKLLNNQETFDKNGIANGDKIRITQQTSGGD